MIRTSSALTMALLLASMPGTAAASSYYLGVMGGVSEFRGTTFNHGDEGEVAVEADYSTGDTLSISIGRASEGSDTFRGRSELEFGFQRANVDRMTFVERELEEEEDEDEVDPVDPEEPVDEPDRDQTRERNVSGTTEAAFGFFNAYGDFWVRENLALVAGFGFGVGEVRFDNHSAEGEGVVMDDSDVTYGFQISGGIAWQVWDRLDLEASYRLRSWEDVSLRSDEDRIKSKVRVPSQNLQAGIRFRF